MIRLLCFLCILSAPLSAQTKGQFIVSTDPHVEYVAGIPLRESWWSRPYEYAWAEQFVGPNLVVLDAACGISHPFKWLLGVTCKETWACDIDFRILHYDQILAETQRDLGYEAYRALNMNFSLREKVNRVKASICELPDTLPQFDRIFCISTLEHMDPASRKEALSEFARKLKPDGLVVITVAYPLVQIPEFLEAAKEAGLEPVSGADLEPPPPGAITDSWLSIYRCVFKHQRN